MNIVFRTDASLQIGTGHVMRCLTLADALQAVGARCYFICREHPGNLNAQIRKRGFSVSILPAATGAMIADKRDVETRSSYATWLGVDWETDAAQTKIAVGGMIVDWLIVDHYALDICWEQALRPLCRKLMVIDDLADRPHNCDLLLDQNLGRDVHDYRQLVPTDCTVLIGPYNALLRPEFSAMREYSLRRRQALALKHVLITMGGVDQPNAASQVLEALKHCLLPVDCKITVVMGDKAPWIMRVREIAAIMPWTTEVRVDITDMAQVMAESDLAIGAAGTTSWERCCLGLPAIMVVLADNQLVGAHAMQAAGAASLIGEPAAIQEQLTSALLSLMDGEALESMSRLASNITDGQGAIRVVECMEHLQ